jgi:hypothetical protein
LASILSRKNNKIKCVFTYGQMISFSSKLTANLYLQYLVLQFLPAEGQLGGMILQCLHLPIRFSIFYFVLKQHARYTYSISYRPLSLINLNIHKPRSQSCGRPSLARSLWICIDRDTIESCCPRRSRRSRHSLSQFGTVEAACSRGIYKAIDSPGRCRCCTKLI